MQQQKDPLWSIASSLKTIREILVSKQREKNTDKLRKEEDACFE
jgi:hypothetical protein